MSKNISICILYSISLNLAMSYDDLDLLKTAFKSEKRGTPVNVEAEKIMQTQDALLAKPYAHEDMNKEYNKVVDSTIDDNLSYDAAFINTPPAQPADMLIQEHMDNNRVIQDSVNKSYSLEEAINLANQGFGKSAGLKDISKFMNRIAATESNLGQDSLKGSSYSAFQIDPIRYQDIVQRAGNSEKARQKTEIANKFLKDKLGDSNFDIRNLFEVKDGKYVPNKALRDHDNLIGATLTRLALSHIEEDVPADEHLASQAGYWKNFWNSLSGDGDIMNFINQSKYHESRE